jgi:hypothetical protein
MSDISKVSLPKTERVRFERLERAVVTVIPREWVIDEEYLRIDDRVYLKQKAKILLTHLKNVTQSELGVLEELEGLIEERL